MGAAISGGCRARKQGGGEQLSPSVGATLDDERSGGRVVQNNLNRIYLSCLQKNSTAAPERKDDGLSACPSHVIRSCAATKYGISHKSHAARHASTVEN